MIVLATRDLLNPGGGAAYLITVAEHLERLGHEVVAYAEESGDMARLAEERGVRVARSLHALPGRCEGVVVQDPSVACRMAERYPDAARVYVAHEAPARPGDLLPRVPDLVRAVVVMNDRVGRRLHRSGIDAEIVRLRQPIDLHRFAPTGIRRARPRKVLLFGNYLQGPRLSGVLKACERLGLEVDTVGRRGRVSTAPELELADADIVLGVGRCAIEALSCARAALVLGMDGGDGWVTPDSYEALEADGFAGVATDRVLDEAALAEELSTWSPRLGESGRDLAVLHHGAAEHAAELVATLDRLGARPAPRGTPLEEMSRLVRLQAQARQRSWSLGYDNARLRIRVEQLEREGAAGGGRAAARARSSAVGAAAARVSARLRPSGRGASPRKP